MPGRSADVPARTARIGVIAACVAVLGAAGCGSGSSADATLAIYVSAPLSGPDRDRGRSFVAGARAALEESGGEAGGHPVDLMPLDSAIEAGGYADAAAAANARTAASDSTAIAYIGELDRTSRSSLPITREAGLLQVPPFDPPEGAPPAARPDSEAGSESMDWILAAIESAGDPLDRASVADAFTGAG